MGTKSKHERKTWGRWWDRTANHITLDAFVRYSYGEQKVGYQAIESGLNWRYGTFLDGWVNSILTDVLGMDENSTITRLIVEQVSGLELKLNIYKHVYNEGYDVDLYATTDTYSHSKSDAKRIKHVFAWSTAVVTWPPGIKQSAVEFDLEVLRALHTMKHDGYHLGFITDLRD